MARILLKGGCVLTLGARTPNLRQGDVLIEDTVVAEVGVGLRARDAEQVDATDTIVMPGFVDTHRHAWTSLFRNLGDRASDGPSDARLAASAADLGDHFRAEDVYAATLIGLLGAAEAGITTVVDWSHLRADDGLDGRRAPGPRRCRAATVFVHAPRRRPRTVTPRRATRQHVARLADAAGPLTTVAFGAGALRGDRSRQGRRRVGAGPGAGLADPCPRGAGSARDVA